jgi:hypothetical protein
VSAGVTAFESAEFAEVASIFLATAKNVYGVPFVNPVIVNGLVVVAGFKVVHWGRRSRDEIGRAHV